MLPSHSQVTVTVTVTAAESHSQAESSTQTLRRTCKDARSPASVSSVMARGPPAVECSHRGFRSGGTRIKEKLCEATTDGDWLQGTRSSEAQGGSPGPRPFAPGDDSHSQKAGLK